MDPWSVLGVPQSATPEEIRRAFRKIAAKYHPDRNPNNKAAEKIYKEASAAYELLTNPRKQPRDHQQTPPPPGPQPYHGAYAFRPTRKKRGARRGYMPERPGAPPRPAPPPKPGSSYTVRPNDVKLGSSVPLKDLPPWMPRAPLFGQDPLDRGGPS